MSDVPHDPLRATRLVLEAQLAARGVSRHDLDGERLRQLTETSGPELRLIAALLDTLEIAPGLLTSSARAEEGAAPSVAPAGDSLAENLLRTGASLPPVAAWAPGELDRLLARVEELVARAKS